MNIYILFNFMAVEPFDMWHIGPLKWPLHDPASELQLTLHLSCWFSYKPLYSDKCSGWWGGLSAWVLLSVGEKRRGFENLKCGPSVSPPLSWHKASLCIKPAGSLHFFLFFPSCSHGGKKNLNMKATCLSPCRSLFKNFRYPNDLGVTEMRSKHTVGRDWSWSWSDG